MKEGLFLRDLRCQVLCPNLAATTPLVVEVVGNVSSPLPTSSMTPILATTISSKVEVVGNVSSSLPTSSTALIPTTTISLIVEVGDDSPSSPKVVVVGSDSLSSLFCHGS
ncbi:hypothetical protein Adt_20446 [Abeliophyllum distichum]|uniref:Uncharacterized protein n=1 Tax=Abeliophyllum distichum TaxID=126358 RepID=A0ABD1SWJ5_9LAMI